MQKHIHKTDRPNSRAAANREIAQRKSPLEEEKMLQGKFEHPVQRKPNRTGLPDTLKSGIEEVSGMGMDDVRVHYNSAKPSQLQAHAYTQGTDIHVAAGQEKHLAHEAWHVVQQKQGRVQPTLKVAGQPVNDDAGLEREADVMGQKVNGSTMATGNQSVSAASASTIQRIKILGKNGVIHINDYHFIDRLAITNAPASGTHDVLLTPFDDFIGLSKAASNSPGKNFTYGDCEWGWRGTEEIFPIANGKTCITLTTNQIGELVTGSQEGNIKKAQFTQALEKDAMGSKAINAIKTTKQQSKMKKGLQVPITTTKEKLCMIPGIRFAPGKHWSDAMENGGKCQAFLMGPKGNKEEGPHLHLFLTCGKRKSSVEESTHSIVIESYHMTTSQKKHLTLTSTGEAVDKDTFKPQKLEKTEPHEVVEMEVMCDMINMAQMEEGTKEKTPEKKVEKKKVEVWEEATEAAGKEAENILILAKKFDIRLKIMEHFLKIIAGFEAEAIAELATGDSTLETYMLDDERRLLCKLDSLAIKCKMNEATLIALLHDHDDNLNDIDTYYQKLMEKVAEEGKGEV